MNVSAILLRDRSVYIILYLFFFFFFSSRRRHTRFDCDWSSDVCSSDLNFQMELDEKPLLVADGALGFAKVDRKSTRLNSSHSQISYAVFCLKKKKKKKYIHIYKDINIYTINTAIRSIN